jgi:D-aminoacyl-tRNA deacylase
MFVDALGTEIGRPVATGRFGADMQPRLANDGPVTMWIDTKERE